MLQMRVTKIQRAGWGQTSEGRKTEDQFLTPSSPHTYNSDFSFCQAHRHRSIHPSIHARIYYMHMFVEDAHWRMQHLAPDTTPLRLRLLKMSGSSFNQALHHLAAHPMAAVGAAMDT